MYRVCTTTVVLYHGRGASYVSYFVHHSIELNVSIVRYDTSVPVAARLSPSLCVCSLMIPASSVPAAAAAVAAGFNQISCFVASIAFRSLSCPLSDDARVATAQRSLAGKTQPLSALCCVEGRQARAALNRVQCSVFPMTRTRGMSISHMFTWYMMAYMLCPAVLPEPNLRVCPQMFERYCMKCSYSYILPSILIITRYTAVLRSLLVSYFEVYS